MNEIRFELTQKNIDNLETYGAILKKDTSTMFNEALQMYFEKTDELLAAQTLDGDGANTNLDYDEFWDGVDV